MFWKPGPADKGEEAPCMARMEEWATPPAASQGSLTGLLGPALARQQVQV